ncbi:MAG: porin [Actinomycetia bacterium]|nr:porin [Actinomycetes bacterium]
MKKIFFFCAVIGMALAVNIVCAEDTRQEKLFIILRDNGTITQEQYNLLMEAAENRAQKTEESDMVDVKVSTKGGIKVETYDGKFSAEIGGRLFIDAAYYEKDKNPIGNGTELRRARLGLEGSLFADWEYEFELDFADGDADIKDAYIRYVGFRPAAVTVGQFEEPFSLEEQTSSKYITFMERALPNEFVPDSSIGFGIHHRGKVWTAALGLFGESFDDDVNNEGDEGWGVTGRATWAPLCSDTRLLHFGTAVSYREINDEEEVKFSARPESHVTDIKYIDTGDIINTDSLLKYGLEFAGVVGPFSLQGEYIRTDVCRYDGFEDITFDGWYLYGSWFLTGESRNYKSKKGAFGRVKPTHKLGALELALRYSTIDLNDGPITGGEEKNITFGLNWYINPYIKFMTNYIMVDNDEHADADGDVIGNDDPKIFQTRFQVDF